MTQIVVIGAGIGGLTAAAALARAGLDVTVLEAQIYPGGCAGTFFHQGYRFDAGATLAGGFYPGGPMERVAQAVGLPDWPARPAGEAMTVHLPESDPLPLHGREERWAARQAAFGPQAEPFFQWQEQTAQALWELALDLPAWPPQSPAQLTQLARRGLAWLGRDWSARLHPAWLADAFRPVSAHLRGAPEKLRLFADAQLLISAQATSRAANALYGASALDLPRRGVVHLEGGMGAIAQALAGGVRSHGGRVLYRQEVTQVVHPKSSQAGARFEVLTKRGERFPANRVIFNLPAPNIRILLGGQATEDPDRPPAPEGGWGAFVVYLGIDAQGLPAGFPLHHQVVARRPLGEGNSVFLSLSPAWDASRAPDGQRAVTLSTHTALAPWWERYERDRPAYEALKDEYTARLLEVAEAALPGLGTRTRLVMPGTPVTFQRFTRRAWGWVGGIPQTSLFRAAAPALGPGLWMVGDSIFPGQSVPAVALGGLRVAQTILSELAVTGKRSLPGTKMVGYGRAEG